MVSRGATVLLCFTWWLCFSMWGWCGCASLPPTPTYKLWLTGEGTEPSDRRCPVPSLYAGRHGHNPPFWGLRSPQAGLCALVLTVRVPG
jgi:hypothetical protein